MKFITADKDIKLKMFERTMMDESVMKEENGKKKFVKTGGKVEMTTYFFRDGFGDVFKILSKENSYRNLEGESVRISLEIKFDEFKKINRISLSSCEKIEKGK